MNVNLWFGSVTTLVGGLLGGAISFALSRQQIKDARAQRAEQASLQARHRSIERRADAYASFMTHARSFRNSIRPYRTDNPVPGMTVKEIEKLARSADDASSLVFLLLESPATLEACRTLVRQIGEVVGCIHQLEDSLGELDWDLMNEDVANALRKFQVAAREELGVGGIERATMLPRDAARSLASEHEQPQAAT